MIPSPIPFDATPGERRVYDALAALPNEITVCYRRPFPGRRRVDEPDFVLVGAEIGLIVLEVKDWRKGKARSASFRENPLGQAKRYVHGLQDHVRKHGFPVLVEAQGPHAQDLVFPCAPAVVLPYLARADWQDDTRLDIRHLLFREDLPPDAFFSALCRLARLYFRPHLSPAQVEFLRGLVAPEFCLEPMRPTAPPRQLDPVQLQLVTTDLFLPPPERDLARDLSVRMVRGVAGSGKTLLLLMRARLLQQLQPSWRTLLLTYNRDLADFLLHAYGRLGGKTGGTQITHFHKWCRDLLVEAGQWQEPVNRWARLELIGQAEEEVGPVAGLKTAAVADEIEWLKEYVEAPIATNYLAAERVGRSGRLLEPQRRAILAVLGRYAEILRRRKLCDWEDVPLRVLELIEAKRIAAPRYHAVLVDETQDFAPSWFRLLLRMIRPETNLLFLAGDGAQRVYRPDLCWNRLGIPLRGRSRILRRVYRSTAEIGAYAAEWMRKIGAAEDLRRYGEEWVEAEFDHDWARHGSDPLLVGFADLLSEQQFLRAEIRNLLAKGLSPGDILILHARRDAALATATVLNRSGIPAAAVKDGGLVFDPPTVNVCTYHSAKGLEFPVVFCNMGHLFPDSRDFPTEEATTEAEAEAARLLYVGMTRAKDQLYVTYVTK
jgi:superfamily I DNA/RNA helicase